MISLGSNDARKGLKFAGREMEETELEEGEACSYSNNNDDYDATTDTENDLSSLSYIDEKLQHVLGHFQKDFEGGVSAENLGAKFGGYGSFLPTYTLSQGWPHPNGSPKVQSWHAPRSPPKMPLEDGRHNSVCSSSGSQSLRPGLPLNFETLRKTSTVNDSIKQGINLTSAHVDELASRCEFASKKAASLSDPKTLKVRIKMGSGDLSTQKNAAIYSGLGLDVSPSSSLDQSPSESEGMYQESQEPLTESPTSILRLMTSFPVPEEALLSPLPDHLLNLIVKEKKLKENRSDSRKRDGMLSRHKKAKSMEKKNSPAERTSGINREIMNGSGLMPEKEADIDLLAFEELVSKTLKLPLLSNSYSASEKVKNKGTTRNKGFHDVDMEGSVEPLLAQEIGWENPSASSAQKVLEEQKTSVLDVISGNARKDGYNKADKTYDSVKANSNTLKGCKALKNELVDPSKKKISQRATLDEQDNMKLPSAEECLSSGGKRKSKDSQRHGSLAAGVPKESLRVGFSLMARNKQTAHANSYANKRELGDKKLESPFRKAEDRYKDFFGDTGESEQEENQASSLELCSKDQLKEADNIEKSTSSINSAHSERLSGKKTEDLLATESYPRATVDGASNSTNVNVAGTSHATAAPVMIRENWVCCDKCQKWRLLPVSINPADLPEKWLCSMLNWLPAMDHCSIDEEETTKAVLALYHVPTVENQTNLQSNLGSIMSRLPSADALRLDQNQLSFGSHAMLTAARKKHGLKEISNAMDKDGPTPMKKTQSSVRSRNLTDVTRSSVSEEPGLHHLSKSDLPVKKHKNKRKDKHKLSKHGSVGGDAKTSKMKSKRTADQDSLSTNNALPTTLGKDQPKHSEPSYKVSKSDKERQQISGKRPKDKVHPSLTDGSLDLVNCNGGEVSRKRKVDECIDGQLYTGLLQGVGNHFQDSRVFTKEDVSENEYRREKKARVSKSGGKDSSAGKSSGKLEKKSRHTKDHQTGQDLGSSLPQRSLDVPDSLKRDFGSAQPSLAATSSSSKVSGSHKSKSGTHKSKHCFNETKGSPVESVSSSPMRIANPDKLPSTRRNVAGSPRRSSDGEDDGGSDRSGTVWREKISCAPQHGSLESSIHDIQDKDHGQLDGSKAKALESSPEVRKGHFMNGGVDYLGQEAQYAGKSTIMDEYHYEKKQNDKRGNANVSHPRKSVSGSQTGNRADESQGDDALKVQKQIKKSDQQNGIQHSSSRHTSGGRRIRDVDAPSPMRKDFSSLAATNALKEAKDLKHLADRFKNSGSNVESTALYFQAALKFLHSASLLESCNSDSAKHGEMIQSMQIYSSTAKLCEFCAHEYERLKDMAAASLAYKCMEVAYMRVIYSSHGNANRDRHELQTALQMVPPVFCTYMVIGERQPLKFTLEFWFFIFEKTSTYDVGIYTAGMIRVLDLFRTGLVGESPSSSASDVDNLNHPTAADKVAFPKGVNSPQVVGNHVISARNRPNFVRLLNFAQDINHAMEASRKSRTTFLAASSNSKGAECGKSISSVKKALDFNFLDVEGMLHLEKKMGWPALPAAILKTYIQKLAKILLYDTYCAYVQ
ncbi:hypothetical protein GOBAR_DD07448 [Gossypium barbadense]|nr:hypothetical protein GOBAR_DD07448 [Gossypium barbadense]